MVFLSIIAMYILSICYICNIECGNVLQLEAARGMKEFIQ